MAPCNCGKSAAAVKYIYTSPQGKKTEYTSEVQAQAAQVRDKSAGRGIGRYTTAPE